MEKAVPEFAHNPQIRQLPDGSFVMFMIGGWPETPCQCKYPLDGTKCARPHTNLASVDHLHSTSRPPFQAEEGGLSGTCSCGNWTKQCGPTMPGPTGDCCGPTNPVLNSGCGLAVARAPGLSGPWKVAPLRIEDQWDSDNVYCTHTNPSPVLLPNGTAVMAFNAGCCVPGCPEVVPHLPCTLC